MSLDIRSMITLAEIPRRAPRAIALATLLALLTAYLPAQDPAVNPNPTPTPTPDPATNQQPAAQPQNPAPAPAPAANPADAAPVTADCVSLVLEEQRKTREVRELRNPLPHPDKDTATRIRRDYLRLLADGYNAAADAKIIQDYLSYAFLRATEADFVASPANTQQLLKELESDIQRSGNNIGNPANQLAARKKFCADALAALRPLLANSLDARITAVSAIKLLHEVRAVQGGALAKIHPEALTTLLDILAADDQPNSVKAVTAGALRHVLRNCDLIETEQFRICDGIAAQLDRKCTESAYQLVLLETLFEVRKARRTVGRPEPTAMKSFAAVLDDRSRPIEVRCLAAMGVGRGAWDTQMKADPFAWKIAQLAGDAAIEFNRDPGNAKWPNCGASLIFAFRQLAEAETTPQNPADRKGLLNRAGSASKTVTDAAPLVKIVGIGLINNNAAFPAEQVVPLAQWIQANQPENLKWDENLPPLSP